MKWWTHLWLNEGFASFMEYLAVDKLFPKWNVWTQFVFTEQANAIQTDEGFKTKKRKKSDVTDSVCDVLFEILLIANHYNIDLDNEYPKVLKQIEQRRKDGEFDH